LASPAAYTFHSERPVSGSAGWKPSNSLDARVPGDAERSECAGTRCSSTPATSDTDRARAGKAWSRRPESSRAVRSQPF
jgi:hypothetical protein